MTKPNSGQFKPGQSGNPGGRPKIIAEVAGLARAYTAEALETLRSIMLDKRQSGAARVAASCAILDRGYGRPAQSLDVGIRKTIEEMSDAELIAIAGGAEAEVTEH
jgi:hypothetical protein